MIERFRRPQPQVYLRSGPSPTRVGATIVLVLALLAGLGFGSQWLANSLWDRVVEYQSPYARPLPAVPTQVPALANSLVLFVIDGLRVDASRGMANLNALRTGAFNLVATTEQPSLSLPGGAALGTGTPPYVHGVTTNWYEGPIKVDDLFAAAKRSGVPTAFIGWDGWIQLYGASITTAIADPAAKTGVYDDSAVRDLAAAHLAAGAPPGLTVVYFSTTDEAGHDHGGASEEYRSTAATVDGYLGELLALLDLDTTAVIVTADHGHIDTGGHGGPEDVVTQVPLVLAGAGFVRPAPGAEGAADGSWPFTRQIDIAPTIAAILGTEVPSHALGQHLSGCLAGDTAWQAARMLLAAKTRLGVSAMITGLGTGGVPAAVSAAEADLAGGKNAEAFAAAADFMRSEAAERASVQGGLLAARQAGRFWPSLAAVLLPLAVMLFFARPPRLWGMALCAGLFLLGFWLVYSKAHGLEFSFSAFNSEEQASAFINLRVIEGALLMLVTGLAGALVARDIDFGLQTSAGLGAVWTGALAVYGLALPIIWFYYQQGFNYPDFLPNFVGGFKSLVHLLTMTGAGFAAVAATLLGIWLSGVIPARRTARSQWRYR